MTHKLSGKYFLLFVFCFSMNLWASEVRNSEFWTTKFQYQYCYTIK